MILDIRRLSPRTAHRLSRRRVDAKIHKRQWWVTKIDTHPYKVKLSVNLVVATEHWDFSDFHVFLTHVSNDDLTQALDHCTHDQLFDNLCLWNALYEIADVRLIDVNEVPEGVW